MLWGNPVHYFFSRKALILNKVSTLPHGTSRKLNQTPTRKLIRVHSQLIQISANSESSLPENRAHYYKTLLSLLLYHLIYTFRYMLYFYHAGICINTCLTRAPGNLYYSSWVPKNLGEGLLVIMALSNDHVHFHLHSTIYTFIALARKWNRGYKSITHIHIYKLTKKKHPQKKLKKWKKIASEYLVMDYRSLFYYIYTYLCGRSYSADYTSSI